MAEGRRPAGAPRAAGEAAKAPGQRPAADPGTRTIRVADVVKALEIAAERLGDNERSCETLRAWAAEGRVTPAGQVLTPEAVAAGIEAWLSRQGSGPPAPAPAPAPAPERKPATPQAKRGRRAAPEAPAEPAQARAAVAASASTARPDPPTALAPADAAALEPGSAKRAKRLTYEEAREERQRTEARVREMAQGRLSEVLAEIGGHLEEILRRTGPLALAQWRAALGTPDADRRDLYMRLVHAVQDPEVRQPEELRGDLLPHQLEGLEWLASLYANGLHGILADEMGLGKTVQTIALLLYLQERKGNAGPHLVVAPKSCLSNWQAEFQRFAPNCSVHLITGDAEERGAALAALRRAMASGALSVCVTNYEQVYRNEWLLSNQWQLIVVDEGHRLKNPETVLHSAMKQLRCRMRLLLTGTPLQNSINELWALLHYLLPDIFTCMMDFKAWFSSPFTGLPGVNEFEVQLEPEQEQQVISHMHSLLAPFLLQRLKRDVLADKLPPRVEVLVRVPLSAWQQAAYQDLEGRTIRLLGDDDGVSSEQVNNALMQLRKICLHPYLFQDSYPSDENLFRSSGKVEALDRILARLLPFGHKVLIFSQFTSVLDILQAFLVWRGIGFVRLDGQVPHEQRRDRMARFQGDPKVPVFLLSARAGGLGLNLQAADTVVLFDLDWNPQNDKQAIARVHRVGQTREVRVIRLVTDTKVERHMEQRCLEKLEMEEKIMGAGMFRRQATADMRRQALRAVLGLEEAAAAPGKAQAAEAGADAMTPPAELSARLARGSAEQKAFAEMDAALFQPASGGVGGAGDAATLLVRCGRLMAEAEVPAGFTGFCEQDGD